MDETLFIQWPHRPAHLFTPAGSYMVTAGTLHKAPLFHGAERLRVLQSELFAAALAYGWQLEAWAIFANHYHFVGNAPDDARTLPRVVGRVHSATARWLNRLQGRRGRQVWYQYWDTCMTFESSYYARLHYVHQNPVHHRIVENAQQYAFCSAAWFVTHADPELCARVAAQPYDQLSVRDDF
jgi:putative transposase